MWRAGIVTCQGMASGWNYFSSIYGKACMFNSVRHSVTKNISLISSCASRRVWMCTWHSLQMAAVGKSIQHGEFCVHPIVCMYSLNDMRKCSGTTATPIDHVNCGCGVSLPKETPPKRLDKRWTTAFKEQVEASSPSLIRFPRVAVLRISILSTV